jgi:hypothetical protein
MSKVVITIQGPVSAMKSPMARRIKHAIETTQEGMTVAVFDHELFSFDRDFEKSRKRVYEDAKASLCNVSVVVIGTGVGKDGERLPLDVRVEPGISGAALLFRAFEAMAGEWEST